MIRTQDDLDKYLASLPDNLTVGGGLDLSGTQITALPDNLTVGGYLNLRGTQITALPDNLTVGGGLDLNAGKYSFKGVFYDVKNIDGVATILGKPKKLDETTTVYAAHYFHVDDRRRRACYVANIGENFAHGQSLNEALEDCRFKTLETMDKDDLRDSIRAAGVVTVNDFRVVTGACRDGMRQHLAAYDVDIDKVSSLPLDQALNLMAGSSFGNSFANFIGRV